MDLNNEKIEIIKLLLEVEDVNTLHEIRTILTGEHISYEDLPEHVKESINRGLQQMENGETQDHESVMREMKIKHGLSIKDPIK